MKLVRWVMALAISMCSVAVAAQEINFGIIATDSASAQRERWEPFFRDMEKKTGLKVQSEIDTALGRATPLAGIALAVVLGTLLTLGRVRERVPPGAFLPLTDDLHDHGVVGLEDVLLPRTTDHGRPHDPTLEGCPDPQRAFVGRDEVGSRVLVNRDLHEQRDPFDALLRQLNHLEERHGALPGEMGTGNTTAR